MVSFSNVVWIVLIGWFGKAFFDLWVMWNPAPCESGNCLHPLFQPDDMVDYYVYGSTSNKPATSTKRFAALGEPFWNATGVRFDKEMTVNATVPLPDSVRNNGTLYAHVFMVRAGGDPSPAAHKKVGPLHPNYESHEMHQSYRDLVYLKGAMTRHQSPVSRNRTMLLGGEMEVDEDGEPVGDVDAANAASNGTATGGDVSNLQKLAYYTIGFGASSTLPISMLTASGRWVIVSMAATLAPGLQAELQDALLSEDGSVQDLIKISNDPPVTHWKGKIQLQVVQDFSAYSLSEHGWPPGLFVTWSEKFGQLINRFYKLHPVGRGQQMKYMPEVSIDEWSMLTKYFRPLSTNTSAPDPLVFISLRPMTKTRFQIMKQFEGSTRAMTTMGFSERDMDDVKQLITETSLRMLALTYVISFAHLFFDYLAFKNDVGFFKNRKDYTGISGRSLLSNFVCSLVIVLYLMDNEFTSRIVLGSVVVSTFIEGWKVFKVMKPTCIWAWGLPWTGSANPATKSKGEDTTNDIDVIGFGYLQIALYPLVVAWAIYSLFTEAHKSWWSWAIHALAHGVYTFGFVLMTPQLFINYKLKSVAHLPWKVMMYKAFNTFIDDVFSFIMVMPTSHRIACLRDDLVFFIYLYQRYIYRVDMKRANEFGIAYEEDEAATAVNAGKPGGGEPPSAAKDEAAAAKPKQAKEKKDD
jgi:hypothetical protein